MRRSSFTSLFSAALLGHALLAPPPAPAVCLPPTFDGGKRLHQLPTPTVNWLQILLRQHEACWRTPRDPDELRVFVVGSSAVYGFPLPADQTFTERLNERFAAHGVAAHLFNLGYVTTYQLKDALILYAALDYAPDVIVYPISLADFMHRVPALFPPMLIDFFDVNDRVVGAMAARGVAGLEEPLAVYGDLAEHPESWRGTWLGRLQDVGALVRLWVNDGARSGSAALGGGSRPPPPVLVNGRQRDYDCPTTQSDFAEGWPDWKSWNVLAWLQQLQATRGTPVVVVNAPVAHEPVGACYDVRYPTAAFEEYVAWLRDEAERRGLAYVDLHDAVPADEFVDSIHVDAAGHRRIAERLEAPLVEVLKQAAARRARATGR